MDPQPLPELFIFQGLLEVLVASYRHQGSLGSLPQPVLRGHH